MPTPTLRHRVYWDWRWGVVSHFRSEQRPAGRKRRALACSMGYPSAPSKPRHFITTRQFQDPSARPAWSFGAKTAGCPPRGAAKFRVRARAGTVSPGGLFRCRCCGLRFYVGVRGKFVGLRS